MAAADRAKQFLPFAALKGLPEALAKKERVAVPKIVLSEDMAGEDTGNRAGQDHKRGVFPPRRISEGHGNGGAV